MSDSIGNAAGVIWKFLDANGATSVSKLTKDTGLETKLAQRAIGWLAAEGKLMFEMKGRTETIALK
ncbi:MAG: winged helix-turn-helix domain-containing protein [Gammaproteobacteria bacterium]|nr:winged helix-turn-helix domain-containing protein [Gammaproteobacteria bacterium]